MDELLRIYPNDNLSVNIDNLGDKNANEFAEFEILLEKEGEPILTDVVELDIEPGHNYWYFFEPDENLENGEYVYTVTGRAKKGAEGLKKGTVLAHNQKVFNIEGRPESPKEVEELEELQFEETEKGITIQGKGFRMVFSRGLGGLTELEYNGIDYLNSKPTVTFWRPLTDTDLTLGLNYVNGLWLGATIGQQLLPDKYYFEKVEDCFKLTFVYQYPLPGGQESAVIYTVHPDGTLGVETIYSGLATMDYLPAFGMDFKLNKDLDTIKYYGYGPDENYIDTTEGLDLNVYETTVRKNYKKNERPTETGNRTGVRWAEVYNSKTGKGLKFTAESGPFEFSALPYNGLEIEAAQTNAELPKIVNTNVRIAGKVSGVGNGSYLDEWAKIDAGEMIDLKFNISPVEIEVAKPSPEKGKKKPVSAAAEEPAAEGPKAKKAPAPPKKGPKEVSKINQKDLKSTEEKPKNK